MADAKIHLETTWEGGFKGQGLIRGDGFEITTAIPAALGGSGVGADPKQLYVAAATACFTATLRAITESKKVPVETIAVTTHAIAGEKAFSIVHTVRMTLSADAGEAGAAAAQAAADTADKICVVGNLARAAGVEITKHVQFGEAAA